ncbi:MAG: glutathione S-transferase family protein [Proteobacteria bacterium]|nr:glutathione S-transferase family protein [Pseudomonadota bacterium]
MIKLYGFGKNLGLADASPFVTKIHAFLKIANLDYETVAGLQSLSKSPKGKLPFITDGQDTIADSRAIIEYLTKKYSLTLDAHLNTQQLASAYLFEKSLDENLYWCLVWSRWIHEESWQTVKAKFFQGIPFPIAYILPKALRKKVKKSLHAQGMGRHSEQEIIAIAQKSFQALSAFLGENTYFFGNKISSFDATAYAFIASFTQAQLNNDINTKAKSHKNLVVYCENFRQLYFA